MEQSSTVQSVRRLGLSEIQAQLARCPSIPSLGSINKALQGLLLTEQRYTAQIAEIIRRDPSLTSRLLRLVNSVYFGLTTPVNSIEEAVFYLGVRQIRQLAMVTPGDRGFSAADAPMQVSLARILAALHRHRHAHAGGDRQCARAHG